MEDQEALEEHFTPVNVEKLYVVQWCNLAILPLLCEAPPFENI